MSDLSSSLPREKKPLQVLSLAQHLRLKYSITQKELQSSLGCSYYKLRKLLDGRRVPSSVEVRSLKSVFPSEEVTLKRLRNFEAYDLEHGEGLKDPRRPGMLQGTLRNVDSAAQIRAATPLDPTAVLRHSLVNPRYSGYATAAVKCPIPIRLEHLSRIKELAAVLGESQAKVLRRVLNFTFDQLQEMPVEDLGTSSSMGGTLWALDRDPELQEVMLEAQKIAKVPEPILTSGLEALPSKSAEAAGVEDDSQEDTPEDDFASGAELGDSSRTPSDSSSLFTMASSRVWNPTLLTPAADEEQDS